MASDSHGPVTPPPLGSAPPPEGAPVPPERAAMMPEGAPAPGESAPIHPTLAAPAPIPPVESASIPAPPASAPTTVPMPPPMAPPVPPQATPPTAPPMMAPMPPLDPAQVPAQWPAPTFSGDQQGVPGAYPPAPSPYTAHGGVAQAPTPMPLAPREPMKPTTKRALIASLVGVGVIGVLIGGAAIALSIMNGSRTPVTVVEEYLALLADGKAEAATAMVDPGLSTNDSKLLTDEILAGAEERLTVIKVEALSRHADGAEVEAVMELAGDRFSYTFSVEPGPKEWLFLDTWKLEDALIGELFINTDPMQGEVTISGVDTGIGSTSDLDQGTLFLYPAIYTVASPDSKYFTQEKQSARVWGPYEYSDVWIEVETNAAFEQVVLEQINKLAQACVTVPTNMATECPSIVRSATLSAMEVTESASTLDYITADTFESGWMTIGVRNASAEPDSAMRTERVYVYGSIEWKDGEPTLTDYRFY